MKFSSIVRFLAQPGVVGLGGSALLHGSVAWLIIYLLLAMPSQVWQINMRRGEAVVLQVQMASVAVAMPEPPVEVEVSVEPVRLEPPPPVTVDHTPVRDTLEAVPAVIPLAKNGEYEPSEAPPSNKPPESPQHAVSESKPPPRPDPKPETPEVKEVAAKSPPRQVAEQLVISQSNVTVAAVAPAVAGAQVDELPQLPFNREVAYPLDALYARREGRVVLLVKISATGKALDISVSKSSGIPSLDQSAIAAVRHWRFTPARLKGVPVLHEALVPVDFSISRG